MGRGSDDLGRGSNDLGGAVMIWAGACSNTNFPTLKRPRNAKKAKCDGPTDGRTDRPTDTVTYRSGARDKKRGYGKKERSAMPVFVCPGVYSALSRVQPA